MFRFNEVSMTKTWEEARKEYNRQWREKNRDRLNENARKWREENRERRNAYMKEWRKNHPDRLREYARRYWERKAEAEAATA